MECKNMTKLKNEIDCILEVYHEEVNSLIDEVNELSEFLESSTTKDSYRYINSRINEISTKTKLLDSCKEECIKDL